MEQHSGQDTHPIRRPAVLTIAGSDSGGGAGIQADLRTICAHRLHPLTAITALTAQNTRGVRAIQPCSLGVLRAQIESALEDFDVRAVKIGMLATAEVIRVVEETLRAAGPLPIVLDPVMVATSGAVLLEPPAVQQLVSNLFPLARVVTPNLPEAQLLGAPPVQAPADLAGIARAIRSLGAVAVLVKGGHLDGDEVVDLLDDGSLQREFRHPRLPVEGHGTGCTLSTAIACGLARGFALEAAVAAACDFVHGALRTAYRAGRAPLSILEHDWQSHPA